VIINFVIAKYHKIVIIFLKMWPFPNFHFLMFKIFILFISFFAVYFLLAYLNVHNLIFLSMVCEYAYKTYEYISKLANW